MAEIESDKVLTTLPQHTLWQQPYEGLGLHGPEFQNGVIRN